MKGKVIISTALCGLFAVTGAFADAPVSFNQLDADSDRYITQDEVQARPDLVKNWTKADVNADGRLTVDEYASYEGAGRYAPAEEADEDVGIGAAPAR